MKKVGKTTRPFSYDLNQIPYDYTVEVRNRFKGLDLIDRVPDELWTEVRVKRLLAKMNGDLIIRSDNKDYPDEIIQKDDDSIHFHIIGRVVDKSGNGGL